MNGMQGLFNVLGGGSMMGMQDFLSPEQQRAIQQQSMMAMAAKLLQAGGPSTTPTSLGQAIGGAFEAGQGAMQSGQTNAVQQMLLRQKLEEGKLQKDQAARIAEIFGAGQPAPTPLTGVDAINAPGAAAGPTMGRAAAIGTMPAGPSKADQAAKYRQAANVFAADPVKSKAYMDIADQLAPREKFSTTPQFGQSAAGTPISYVLSESGDMKVLDVQQNPDFSYQDMGGYISVRDKRNNKEVEQIKKTMSASEIASNQVARGQLGVAQSNLSLARDRFKSEGYTVQDSDQGKVYVPRDPTKPSIPVLGPSGSQLKARVDPPADFMKSAKKLQDMEGTLKDFKDELAKDLTVFPPEIPLPFGAKIPLPTGRDTATVKAKYNALLMGVKDLYELGALTGPDMGIVEQQLTNPASFSGIFTSRPAMNQQVQVLEDMLARSKQNLSTTYNRPIPGKNITVDY
jgi:hypothetical protein